MRAPIIAFLAITLIFTSCKDSDTSENDSNIDSVTEEKMNSEIDSDKNENSNAYSNAEEIRSDADISDSNTNPESSKPTENEDKTKPTITNSNLSGNYIKMGEEMDNSCACYCVNINYNGTSEMCLTPSKIFIDTRMVKLNNQTTNIFLANPSSKNTEGKDIPWSKFDKNTPIATITSKENGEIELDWLGFYINGDLAIDYAILGKKTLEGNYKKK